MRTAATPATITTTAITTRTKAATAPEGLRHRLRAGGAILTAIPFWLVMDKVFPSLRTTALVILAFAAVQIVVHIVYFLHWTPARKAAGTCWR